MYKSTKKYLYTAYIAMAVFLSICLGIGIVNIYEAATAVTYASIDDFVEDLDSYKTSSGDVVYLLETAEDLINLSTSWNSGSTTVASWARSSFELANDIDMSGISFTPIGYSKAFYIDFSGNGHIIYNLTVNAGYTYVGLFGMTSNNNIYGLALENYSATTSSSTMTYMGTIVGYSTGSVIEECYATGTASHTSSTTTKVTYVGGLVGYQNGGKILNCYTNVSVTNAYTSTVGVQSSVQRYAAGIAGYSTGSVTSGYGYSTGLIESCNTYGNVYSYLYYYDKEYYTYCWDESETVLDYTIAVYECTTYITSKYSHTTESGSDVYYMYSYDVCVRVGTIYVYKTTTWEECERRSRTYSGTRGYSAQIANNASNSSLSTYDNFALSSATVSGGTSSISTTKYSSAYLSTASKYTLNSSTKFTPEDAWAVDSNINSGLPFLRIFYGYELDVEQIDTDILYSQYVSSIGTGDVLPYIDSLTVEITTGSGIYLSTDSKRNTEYDSDIEYKSTGNIGGETAEVTISIDGFATLEDMGYQLIADDDIGYWKMGYQAEVSNSSYTTEYTTKILSTSNNTLQIGSNNTPSLDSDGYTFTIYANSETEGIYQPMIEKMDYLVQTKTMLWDGTSYSESTAAGTSEKSGSEYVQVGQTITLSTENYVGYEFVGWAVHTVPSSEIYSSSTYYTDASVTTDYIDSDWISAHYMNDYVTIYYALYQYVEYELNISIVNDADNNISKTQDEATVYYYNTTDVFTTDTLSLQVGSNTINLTATPSTYCVFMYWKYFDGSDFSIVYTSSLIFPGQTMGSTLNFTMTQNIISKYAVGTSLTIYLDVRQSDQISINTSVEGMEYTPTGISTYVDIDGKGYTSYNNIAHDTEVTIYTEVAEEMIDYFYFEGFYDLSGNILECTEVEYTFEDGVGKYSTTFIFDANTYKSSSVYGGNGLVIEAVLSREEIDLSLYMYSLYGDGSIGNLTYLYNISDVTSAKDGTGNSYAKMSASQTYSYADDYIAFGYGDIVTITFDLINNGKADYIIQGLASIDSIDNTSGYADSFEYIYTNTTSALSISIPIDLYADGTYVVVVYKAVASVTILGNHNETTIDDTEEFVGTTTTSKNTSTNYIYYNEENVGSNKDGFTTGESFTIVSVPEVGYEFMYFEYNSTQIAGTYSESFGGYILELVFSDDVKGTYIAQYKSITYEIEFATATGGSMNIYGYGVTSTTFVTNIYYTITFSSNADSGYKYIGYRVNDSLDVNTTNQLSITKNIISNMQDGKILITPAFEEMYSLEVEFVNEPTGFNVYLYTDEVATNIYELSGMYFDLGTKIVIEPKTYTDYMYYTLQYTYAGQTLTTTTGLDALEFDLTEDTLVTIRFIAKQFTVELVANENVDFYIDENIYTESVLVSYGQSITISSDLINKYTFFARWNIEKEDGTISMLYTSDIIISPTENLVITITLRSIYLIEAEMIIPEDSTKADVGSIEILTSTLYEIDGLPAYQENTSVTIKTDINAGYTIMYWIMIGDDDVEEIVYITDTYLTVSSIENMKYIVVVDYVSYDVDFSNITNIYNMEVQINDEDSFVIENSTLSSEQELRLSTLNIGDIVSFTLQDFVSDDIMIYSSYYVSLVALSNNSASNLVATNGTYTFTISPTLWSHFTLGFNYTRIYSVELNVNYDYDILLDKISIYNTSLIETKNILTNVDNLSEDLYYIREEGVFGLYIEIEEYFYFDMTGVYFNQPKSTEEEYDDDNELIDTRINSYKEDQMIYTYSVASNTIVDLEFEKVQYAINLYNIDNDNGVMSGTLDIMEGATYTVNGQELYADNIYLEYGETYTITPAAAPAGYEFFVFRDSIIGSYGSDKTISITFDDNINTESGLMVTEYYSMYTKITYDINLTGSTLINTANIDISDLTDDGTASITTSSNGITLGGEDVGVYEDTKISLKYTTKGYDISGWVITSNNNEMLMVMFGTIDTNSNNYNLISQTGMSVVYFADASNLTSFTAYNTGMDEELNCYYITEMGLCLYIYNESTVLYMYRTEIDDATEYDISVLTSYTDYTITTTYDSDAVGIYVFSGYSLDIDDIDTDNLSTSATDNKTDINVGENVIIYIVLDVEAIIDGTEYSKYSFIGIYKNYYKLTSYEHIVENEVIGYYYIIENFNSSDINSEGNYVIETGDNNQKLTISTNMPNALNISEEEDLNSCITYSNETGEYSIGDTVNGTLNEDCINAGFDYVGWVLVDTSLEYSEINNSYEFEYTLNTTNFGKILYFIFEADDYTLTIDITGSGTITINDIADLINGSTVDVNANDGILLYVYADVDNGYILQNIVANDEILHEEDYSLSNSTISLIIDFADIWNAGSLYSLEINFVYAAFEVTAESNYISTDASDYGGDIEGKLEYTFSILGVDSEEEFTNITYGQTLIITVTNIAAGFEISSITLNTNQSIEYDEENNVWYVKDVTSDLYIIFGLGLIIYNISGTVTSITGVSAANLKNLGNYTVADEISIIVEVNKGYYIEYITFNGEKVTLDSDNSYIFTYVTDKSEENFAENKIYISDITIVLVINITNISLEVNVTTASTTINGSTVLQDMYADNVILGEEGSQDSYNYEKYTVSGTYSLEETISVLLVKNNNYVLNSIMLRLAYTDSDFESNDNVITINEEKYYVFDLSTLTYTYESNYYTLSFVLSNDILQYAAKEESGRVIIYANYDRATFNVTITTNFTGTDYEIPASSVYFIQNEMSTEVGDDSRNITYNSSISIFVKNLESNKYTVKGYYLVGNTQVPIEFSIDDGTDYYQYIKITSITNIVIEFAPVIELDGAEYNEEDDNWYFIFEYTSFSQELIIGKHILIDESFADSLVISYAGAPDVLPVNAGVYSIGLSLIGFSNFELTISIKMEITPIELVLMFDGEISKVYDGNSTVTVSGLGNYVYIAEGIILENDLNQVKLELTTAYAEYYLNGSSYEFVYNLLDVYVSGIRFSSTDSFDTDNYYLPNNVNEYSIIFEGIGSITSKEIYLLGLSLERKIYDGTTAISIDLENSNPYLNSNSIAEGDVLGFDLDYISFVLDSAAVSSSTNGSNAKAVYTSGALTGTKASNYTLLISDLKTTVHPYEIYSNDLGYGSFVITDINMNVYLPVNAVFRVVEYKIGTAEYEEIYSGIETQLGNTTVLIVGYKIVLYVNDIEYEIGGEVLLSIALSSSYLSDNLEVMIIDGTKATLVESVMIDNNLEIFIDKIIKIAIIETSDPISLWIILSIVIGSIILAGGICVIYFVILPKRKEKKYQKFRQIN